jgi:hypothetical protein
MKLKSFCSRIQARCTNAAIRRSPFVTIPFRTSGITSRKLSILAALWTSRQSLFCKPVIPNQLQDFVPRPWKEDYGECLVELDRLIDVSLLCSIADVVPVSSPKYQFARRFEDILLGAKLLANGVSSPIVRDLISYIKPSSYVKSDASLIVSCLAAERCISVQLRIENDWYIYWDELKRDPSRMQPPSSVNNFFEAICKLASKANIKPPISVYACCDEMDLGLSKDEIKETANQFSIKLWFQSDFIQPSVSSLERAAIDQEVALSTELYLGICQSSFSKYVAFSDLIANLSRSYMLIGKDVVQCDESHLLHRRMNA